MGGSERITGTATQKDLVKLYAEYVSAPKAQFFKDLGIAFVQGERHGIYSPHGDPVFARQTGRRTGARRLGRKE